MAAAIAAASSSAAQSWSAPPNGTMISPPSPGETRAPSRATSTATSHGASRRTAPTPSRGTPSPSSGRRPSMSTRPTSSLWASRARSLLVSAEVKAIPRVGMPLSSSPTRARSICSRACCSRYSSVCSPPRMAVPRGGRTSRAMMSSRGGSVRASGTASASSWLSAAACWGATRIELPVGSGASVARSSALAASASSGGSPNELCGSISRRIGPAMNVVTSAITTSAANSASRDDAER